MLPSSHQPARFFATAKTHKFENFDDITVDNLKLRPIIDQTGTCYYKTGKVIAKYLRPLAVNEFVINNTQEFSSMLNNVSMSEDEEDVSYDVESLFTNIPIKDTINYICDEIYRHEKLKPLCKESIFKKLLYKITTECTFSANGTLRKQIDGVAMGGTLSVTLSDIFMNKMEKDIVIPIEPKFYRRYVDDTYRRRKKNQPDELFERMNSYHPNIKLTIEVNPSKFLDTKICRNNTEIECFAYHKESKLPFHWTSAVPNSYKRNVVIGDLHRIKKISSNYKQETKVIKTKYHKAGYPTRFINSILNNFEQEKEKEEDELLIPPMFFDERKEVSFQIPYCKRNEDCINKVVKKLEAFTNCKVKFRYYWKTRKLRSLFPLKDPVKHRANLIYQGTCSCKEFYVGETKRNSQTRWKEHCSIKKVSKKTKRKSKKKNTTEVGDHLLLNPGHTVNWEILTSAPKYTYKRKILEAFYIKVLKPTLNNQKDTKKLVLFRNGIT